MKVTLINFNQNKMIGAMAASISVGKDEPSDKGFDNAIASGHLSLLEHFYVSFLISGISRTCSHQLVRHRHATFTQQSQRYSLVNRHSDWYVIPPAIEKDPKLIREYCRAMNSLYDSYQYLLNSGIKKEDARFILPNACTTEIIMSMNCRAFVEQAQLRLCNRAQWEIRELYLRMRQELIKVFPTFAVAKLARPKCLQPSGCTELHPCGRPVTLTLSQEEPAVNKEELHNKV